MADGKTGDLLSLIQNLTLAVSYLAGPEDLKHQRKAVRDQLLGVLLFLNTAELF